MMSLKQIDLVAACVTATARTASSTDRAAAEKAPGRIYGRGSALE
jgi:hypothetical protein